MLSLILVVIFGLWMAYFATQNLGNATIVFANDAFTGIPMYIIVIGSLLVGIFVSWIISMANAFSSSRTIHGKETALNKANEEIVELKHKIHEIEMENANLRDEIQKETKVESREEDSRPSIIDRVRQSFNPGFKTHSA